MSIASIRQEICLFIAEIQAFAKPRILFPAACASSRIDFKNMPGRMSNKGLGEDHADGFQNWVPR